MTLHPVIARRKVPKQAREIATSVAQNGKGWWHIASRIGGRLKVGLPNLLGRVA